MTIQLSPVSAASAGASGSTPIPASAPQGDLPTSSEGFAFLDGHWRVANRRLKEPLSGRREWTEFDTSARFFSLLHGLVSVEELRDAGGKPFGGAMRTFDRQRRTWSDAWVSARDGVLQPPVHGRFEGNIGTWTAQDTHEGQPILVRGIWRRVSAKEVIWEQAASLDGGKSWETNWHMRFLRVADTAKVP